jgi:hypothetical protein
LHRSLKKAQRQACVSALRHARAALRCYLLCLPVVHRFESCSAITIQSWSTFGLESPADALIVHCEINDESSQDKTILATFPASRTEKILSGTLVGPGLVDLVDTRVAFRRTGLVRHASGQAYQLALLTETAAT